MPKIPQDWLDSIVYIYPSEDDAINGVAVGGTGFILTVPCDQEVLPGMHHFYVVTNDHVVRPRDSVAVRINMKDGGFDVLTFSRDDWFPHPNGDDLAVARWTFHGRGYRTPGAITQSMILTREQQEEWEFSPGDDAFFIGRYVDLEGKAHNSPIVRSGMLAGLPSDPIGQPQRGFNQESVLVEARSLNGFSGSPVFVTRSSVIGIGDERPGIPANYLHTTVPCLLLGVDWGHHPWKEDVRSPVTGEPVGDGSWVRDNSGMMMVVPAWKIPDLLAREELVALRKATEDKARLARDLQRAPVMDSAPGDEGDEFSRFEELTNKVVHVSKEEVDAKRREAEQS